MMKLGAACLADALGAFLRAELDSPTEAPRLRNALARLQVNEEVLSQSLAAEDELFAIFQEYRGAEALFEGLELRALVWVWMDLSERDLSTRVRTSRDNFEARYGTRSPARVAALWDRQQRDNGVMRRVAPGVALEPPVLIGLDSESDLVVLEGHNRLISYLRDPVPDLFPVRVLVGTSAHVVGWCQW